MSTKFQLNRRERECLSLYVLGSDTKMIAFEREFSLTTVNFYLRRICKKANVLRKYLRRWGNQNTAALDRGGWATPGLHPLDCQCDEPYCRGARRVG